MLQCRIWDRGTGNVSEWEALAEGAQGEKTKIVAPCLLASFSPVFVTRVADQNKEYNKF